MKWYEKLGVSIVGVIAAVILAAHFYPVVHAQQGYQGATPIQQSATMLNASTKIANTNPGVNNQATATMTPSGANSVYITAIDVAACQDGTATANTNLTFTTTNITGAPIFAVSLTATANLCAPTHTMTFATPLKSSTPGTAVTIVSPAAQAHTAYTINATWYEAP